MGLFDWWNNAKQLWDGLDLDRGLFESQQEQAREAQVRQQRQQRLQQEQYQRQQQQQQRQYQEQQRRAQEQQRRAQEEQEERRRQSDRNQRDQDRRQRDTRRGRERETKDRNYAASTAQDPRQGSGNRRYPKTYKEKQGFWDLNWFDDEHTSAVQEWHYNTYGTYLDDEFATEMGDIAEWLKLSASDLVGNTGNFTAMLFDKSSDPRFQDRGGNPLQNNLYEYIKNDTQDPNGIGQAYQFAKSEQTIRELNEDKKRKQQAGDNDGAARIQKQIDQQKKQQGELAKGKPISQVQEEGFKDSQLKKLTGFDHVFRLAEKYKNDPDSLTSAEKKLLSEGKKRLNVQLKDRSFLENVFGKGDEAIQAGLSEIGEALSHAPIEEEVLGDTTKIIEDYEAGLEDAQAKEDEALKMAEELAEDEQDRARDLQRHSDQVKKFYHQRLGVSDSLVDEGIQQARDYAKSPSVAAETMRLALDKQIEGQAKAYDAANRRFGSGATLADLNRQRQARDINFANQSGVEAMKEQQEKQRFLNNALTQGATNRMGLADFGTLRGFVDDEMSIGGLGSSAKQYNIANLYRGAGSLQDRARLQRDSGFLKQNVGTDQFGSYLDRLDSAQANAYKKNWKHAGAAASTISDLWSGGLKSALTSGLSGKKKEEKKEEK